MPAEENKRLSILDELDQFNTAPQRDSLMLSILAEEEGRTSGDTQAGEPVGDSAEVNAAESDEPSKALPQDHYLPLNTSIQDLSSRVDNRISGIERSIQNLTSNISQQRQQQRAPEPQYDPNAPVEWQHVDSLAKRQDISHSMAVRAFKSNMMTRAHLELDRFQRSNPDFKFNPAEIDHAVNQLVNDGRFEQLEATNWAAAFSQMYEPSRNARYESQAKELDALKKELESLKKQQARHAPPSEPVSPATGRSSRSPAAISSPLQSSGVDDIADMKSFRQKGNFKGFANDLKARARRSGQ